MTCQCTQCQGSVLSPGSLRNWRPSSLPSPGGKTAPAELPAGDIQCRTEVAIVDLDILSLLYLSEVFFTFHYYRLFYHGNSVTCRYLRAEPQRYAPSGHNVGHVYYVPAPHGLF